MGLPKSDATVGVELRVGVHFLNGDADCTGARVAAEV